MNNFKIGEIYILYGNVFALEVLIDNSNLFIYKGIDPWDESFEFEGIFNKCKQWCSQDNINRRTAIISKQEK